MLHLMKLAVGIRDLAHLQQVQADRARANPPLRHLTRNHPRRAAEVLDGGSLYWVVAGWMLVRQRVVDIRSARAEDGTAHAALVLDPVLVPLAGRAARPFQGWRYLEAAAAPPDLAPDASGEDSQALPAALRRELQALGLL
jgi:hypothetical protein